jgi:cytoskeletal protein RodZ
MPTLGEELKRLREKRGLSLAEISEATRIGTRFLKAIEGDNFSILPGGIFTRSFIRAFAKQVGMNEEEAVRRYQQAVSGNLHEAPALTVVHELREQSAEKPITPTQSADAPGPRAEPAPTTRRVEPLVLVNQNRNPNRTGLVTVISLGVAAAVIATLVWLWSRGGSSESSQTPAPASTNQPVASSGQPAAQLAQKLEPASRSGARADASAIDKLLVKVQASSGDSWIKYQVDDSSPTQMILKEGQTQEIPAALNQIKLNYGNRQTLKLTINNREATFPPDTPKFRAQVIISRDNLQAFFQ